MCEMTVHADAEVFNSSRDHLRTQKHQNSWRLGSGPHWGAYTAPQLQALPISQSPTSGWGEATEGPTVEPGPLRALLRHCRR